MTLNHLLLHSFRSIDRAGYSRDDLDFPEHCPPGISRIPQANLESCIGYGDPLKTRDDMARSPSRLILHKSTSLPINNDTEEEKRKATSENSGEDISKEVSSKARFCGPRLFVPHYFVPGPDDWEVAPTQYSHSTNLKADRSSASKGILVSVSSASLIFKLTTIIIYL